MNYNSFYLFLIKNKLFLNSVETKNMVWDVF
jgi:hypothetical protein